VVLKILLKGKGRILIWHSLRDHRTSAMSACYCSIVHCVH